MISVPDGTVTSLPSIESVTSCAGLTLGPPRAGSIEDLRQRHDDLVLLGELGQDLGGGPGRGGHTGLGLGPGRLGRVRTGLAIERGAHRGALLERAPPQPDVLLVLLAE